MQNDLTVIIGAGLSGLHAAWRLQMAGLPVMLIEARARTGGRILSLPMGNGAHHLDLGPSWYWPEFNPLMSEWVQRLKLPHYPQQTQGASFMEDANGAIRRLPDTWESSPPSMRIRGGMTALINGIQNLLTDINWQMNTRVEAIQLLPDHSIALGLAQEGQRWVQPATRVISTLPPRLLCDINSTPSWPDAQKQQWRHTPTWMAGHAKFIALYEHAFWREAGCSGTAMSQRGPLGEIHDASDEHGEHAALFGFFGVPPIHRQNIGNTVLCQQAIDQLCRLFGVQAKLPIRTVIQDWTPEPFTASALDQQPLYHHPIYEPPTVPMEWQGRLWLAGTEFASLSGGFLEGALESAEYATEELLRNMRAPALPP
jgi:monoamine oxidase